MSYESVNQLLADLHAHRVVTMDPASLAVNINQRQELVDHSDYAKFVKAGDVIENFVLADVEGSEVVLDDVLARCPAALVFFRFAGCPACNLTLPNYQRELAPGVKQLGARLIAISPQIPERLRNIKERHQLDFIVASDTSNALGDKFRIVFEANAESQAAALAKGTNMGETIGTGTWELPMPTVIVVGQDNIAHYVKVSPDWLVRAEASEVVRTRSYLANSLSFPDLASGDCGVSKLGFVVPVT